MLSCMVARESSSQSFKNSRSQERCIIKASYENESLWSLRFKQKDAFSFEAMHDDK